MPADPSPYQQSDVRAKLLAVAGPHSPAARASGMNPLIVDIDASLVNVHSDKEGAIGNYKGGSGFSQMIALVDYGKTQGGEVLAVRLYSGNKATNSTKDHFSILTEALEQLPDDFYDPDGVLIGEKIMVRTGSDCAAREF